MSTRPNRRGNEKKKKICDLNEKIGFSNLVERTTNFDGEDRWRKRIAAELRVHRIAEALVTIAEHRLKDLIVFGDRFNDEFYFGRSLLSGLYGPSTTHHAKTIEILQAILQVFTELNEISVDQRRLIFSIEKIVMCVGFGLSQAK